MMLKGDNSRYHIGVEENPTVVSVKFRSLTTPYLLYQVHVMYVRAIIHQADARQQAVLLQANPHQSG